MSAVCCRGERCNNCPDATPDRPQSSRVDIDHYPAWMDENPALFVKSVREFLDQHPADQWDCRISKFVYLVRLTAIRKATA